MFSRRYLPALLLAWVLLECQVSSFTQPLPHVHQLSSGPTSLHSSASQSEEHRHFHFLATCVPGLAEVLAEEMRDISSNVENIQISGTAGVTFTATREASLRLLVHTRVAHRILERIVTTEAFGADDNTCVLYDRDDLYAFVFDQVDAKSLFKSSNGRQLLSMSVRTVLNNAPALPKDLCHSHYSAMTIKRALSDSAVGQTDDDMEKIPVDTDDPDVPLFGVLRGVNNEHNSDELAASLSLYRCMHSPASLHKRGYRGGDDESPIHRAAMKESLAAGLLAHAGWHDRCREQGSPVTLIDPMAGSGTLVVEAALMAADIAPGILRIKCSGDRSHKMPPVVRWNHDVDVMSMWKGVLSEATQRAKAGMAKLKSEGNIRFVANDAHLGAVDLMEGSLVRAGIIPLVSVSAEDCHDMILPEESSSPDTEVWVLTNPPWGVRLDNYVDDSWDSLRYFLRDTCPPGTTAWVLMGGEDDGESKPSQLHKIVSSRLRMKRQGGNTMLSLRTGSQHLRWIQYKIGGGSKPSTPRSDKQENVPKPQQPRVIRTSSAHTFVPQSASMSTKKRRRW